MEENKKNEEVEKNKKKEEEKKKKQVLYPSNVYLRLSHCFRFNIWLYYSNFSRSTAFQ